MTAPVPPDANGLREAVEALSAHLTRAVGKALLPVGTRVAVRSFKGARGTVVGPDGYPRGSALAVVMDQPWPEGYRDGLACVSVDECTPLAASEAAPTAGERASGCRSRNPEPPHQRCENVVCDGRHRDYPADPSRAETRWTDPATPPADDASERRIGECDRHDDEDRGLNSSARCTCPPLPPASTDASEGLSKAEREALLSVSRDEDAVTVVERILAARESAAATRARAEGAAEIIGLYDDWNYCPRCGRGRDWAGETAPGAPCMGCSRYPAARSDAAPHTGSES